MELGPGSSLSMVKLWLCPPAGPLERLWMEFEVHIPWLYRAAAGEASAIIRSAPPTILSKSQLFHPNVASDGRICLGLRAINGSVQDVSLLGAVNILMCLLQNPEDGADDAVNPSAAEMVKDGRYRFFCRGLLERDS